MRNSILKIVQADQEKVKKEVESMEANGFELDQICVVPGIQTNTIYLLFKQMKYV